MRVLADSWNLCPVNRYFKVKLMAGARRSRGEKRDHLFPMLEVKETSAMTHAQKVPAGVRDARPQPTPPTSQRPVSAKRCCVHTGEGPESGQGWAQAQTKQDHGPEEAGRTAPCKGLKPPPSTGHLLSSSLDLRLCLCATPTPAPGHQPLPVFPLHLSSLPSLLINT